MDTVIIDTAGRLSVDEEVMDEIANIGMQSTHVILFVVDSMTGQTAVNTAKPSMTESILMAWYLQ